MIKYKIRIKDSARIQLENGRMMNTPISIPIINENELEKWKLKLRMEGIFNYDIEDLNKTVIPKKEVLKEKIITRTPIRPSRKNKLENK